MLNKTLQLNVTNHGGDSDYSQDFILSSDFSEEKFQEDCAAWEKWIEENKESCENDDDLAEKYWVDFLGYELHWLNTSYDFVLKI